MAKELMLSDAFQLVKLELMAINSRLNSGPDIERSVRPFTNGLDEERRGMGGGG